MGRSLLAEDHNSTGPAADFEPCEIGYAAQRVFHRDFFQEQSDAREFGGIASGLEDDIDSFLIRVELDRLNPEKGDRIPQRRIPEFDFWHDDALKVFEPRRAAVNDTSAHRHEEAFLAGV
jgi:hypothetical protein